jgi:hypothetical protein
VSQLRHVLGYDVSINAQTKRCSEVARRLLLDYDLSQHLLLQGAIVVGTVRQQRVQGLLLWGAVAS